MTLTVRMQDRSEATQEPGGTPPVKSGSDIGTKKLAKNASYFVEMGGVEPPSKQSPR